MNKKEKENALEKFVKDFNSGDTMEEGMNEAFKNLPKEYFEDDSEDD